MKSRLKWILLGLLGIILIGGGILWATFSMPEFIAIEGMEVLGKEGEDIESRVTAKIYNGNFYALGASDLTYVISYRDTVLGRGELAEMDLPGGDTTDVELDAVMDLKGIFSVYKTMMAQPQCTLQIHLDGTFTSLNYHESLQIDNVVAPGELLQQLLGQMMNESSLEFTELKWKPQSLKKSGFEFKVEFENPAPLPFEIKDIRMEFSRDGYGQGKTGEWQMEEPIAVQPNGTVRIPGSVEIDNLQAGADLFTGVFKGEVKYYSVGTLVLGLEGFDFDIPIRGKFIFDLKTQEGRWENEGV